jgi:hypothetical protein
MAVSGFFTQSSALANLNRTTDAVHLHYPRSRFFPVAFESPDRSMPAGLHLILI